MTDDLVHAHLALGQAHDGHAEVQQVGDDREQRGLLAVLLHGGRAEKAAPALPFSAPRTHRPPAWSRNAALCADMRPKRVPVPTRIASYFSSSATVAIGAAGSSLKCALFAISSGKVQCTRLMSTSAPAPRAPWRWPGPSFRHGLQLSEGCLLRRGPSKHWMNSARTHCVGVSGPPDRLRFGRLCRELQQGFAAAQRIDVDRRIPRCRGSRGRATRRWPYHPA